MKKILSFILPLVIFLTVSFTPVTAQAATASSKAGAVTVTSGRLNVRKSPSTTSEVVTTLNKGNYVTLIARQGQWWQVEYGKGQYGYSHSDYITIVEGTPVTVAVNYGTLNVRSGPGTTYSKVGSLVKGETVLLLGSSNGWSRVLYHGTKTGYVSSAYISGTISLNVPAFKQTDSRWANHKIGSTNYTIGLIGCTITRKP